jgi:hypothetical protein
MYNVTLRPVQGTIAAVESNKYYIFLCVCVRPRACVVVGARARTCACSRVALLIQHATHRGLSGSTIFFDIIS